MNTTFQRPLYHSITGSERSSFCFLHFVKALCFEGMIYLSLLPNFPSLLVTALSIITMSMLYGVVFSSLLLSPHCPRLFRAYGAVRSPVFSSSIVLYYIILTLLFNPQLQFFSSRDFRRRVRAWNSSVCAQAQSQWCCESTIFILVLLTREWNL